MLNKIKNFLKKHCDAIANYIRFFVPIIYIFVIIYVPMPILLNYILGGLVIIVWVFADSFTDQM